MGRRGSLLYIITSHPYTDSPKASLSGLMKAGLPECVPVSQQPATLECMHQTSHTQHRNSVCVTGTAARHIRARKASSSRAQQHRQVFVCCMSCSVPHHYHQFFTVHEIQLSLNRVTLARQIHQHCRTLCLMMACLFRVELYLHKL